jgi:ribosome-associated toxin RatA of RatAB toxin-antitoxin module
MQFVPSLYADNTWKLSKQKKGIQVYLRDTPGSALKSFKGVIHIPAKLVALVSVIEDTKAYPQLLHHCKTAHDIKSTGKNDAYKYIVTGMPWPVKDRDAIVYSVMQQNKQTKQVEIKMSASPNTLPLKAGKVRISKMVGRWVLSPEKEGTKVTYEMSVDPAGKLPKFLVNALSTDMPFNTLNNLRNLVKKPVYKLAKHNFIID